MCDSGIYKIINVIDKKVYIGQSIHLSKREKEHFKDLGLNKHANRHLQYAFNEYGKENFLFEILEHCEESELDNREIYYINLYNATNCIYGYNIRDGGARGSFGDETKEKLMRKKMGIPENIVFEIKKELAQGKTRIEIKNKYNITQSAIDAIANAKTYIYINSQVNEKLKKLANENNESRNENIFQLLKDGLTISEISKQLNLSVSIVEKVKYSYSEFVENNMNKKKNIFNKVQEYKNRGYNPAEISRIMNITYDVSYNYYNGENNPYKKLSYKKVTDEIRDKIIELKDNYNYSQISKMVGLSRDTVTRVIKNYNNANTEITSKIA